MRVPNVGPAGSVPSEGHEQLPARVQLVAPGFRVTHTALGMYNSYIAKLAYSPSFYLRVRVQ